MTAIPKRVEASRWIHARMGLPRRYPYQVSRIVASSAKKNVLVVGGGSREHALCWKLRRSPQCGDLYCFEGNAGIFAEPDIQRTTIKDIRDHRQVVEFCQQAQVNVAVIGPEAPLVDGLVDDLTDAGILAFGPSKAAAQLEGSKSFVKKLCKESGISTGAHEVFTEAEAARAYVRSQGAPLVVKADGLAAGKGAIVCKTESEALEAIDRMLIENAFGSAGQVIIIEEFLKGEEASFFALVDGNTVLPLTSAQDHKAVGEGDVGENTGGMGAYSPAPVVTPAIEQIIISKILEPTALAMTEKGMPFRGVLFAGLMINGDRVNLLEYNVRFGDPECQAIMMRLESDLLEMIIKTCDGRLQTVQDIQWSSNWALAVVMASKGYPLPYKKGTIIRHLDRISEAKVFHSGTALNDRGQYVNNGGRALSVTATGSSISQAQEKAYQAVDCIDWSDGFCRRDIGWRAVERDMAISKER